VLLLPSGKKNTSHTENYKKEGGERGDAATARATIAARTSYEKNREVFVDLVSSRPDRHKKGRGRNRLMFSSEITLS